MNRLILIFLGGMLLTVLSCNEESSFPNDQQPTIIRDSITTQSRIQALTKQIASNPEDYALYEDRSGYYYVFLWR